MNFWTVLGIGLVFLAVIETFAHFVFGDRNAR